MYTLLKVEVYIHAKLPYSCYRRLLTLICESVECQCLYKESENTSCDDCYHYAVRKKKGMANVAHDIVCLLLHFGKTPQSLSSSRNHKRIGKLR